MKIKEQLSDTAKAARIAALNDNLRRTFIGGRVMMTSGVAALDEQTMAKVLHAIQTFNDFNPDNDPHGEHDMCFVEVEGERYWSKVDYYDLDERYGSDDPSNPAVTKRVLTLGHVSEY